MGYVLYSNILTLLLLAGNLMAMPAKPADDPVELKLFEGTWTVVKLIENGEVIPPERFSEVLPSGGRVEIVDNSMLFIDAHSGQRHARNFSVDPTRYPSTIDIRSADQPEISRGIYRFDDGQLIICIGDPLAEFRPADLAAPPGSGAMLMVLKRLPASVDEQKKADVPLVIQASPISVVPVDEELRLLLPGVWRIPDQLGCLHLRLRENGTFTSCRLYQELQLFRSVFVQVPVSSGFWEVRQGQIHLNLAASVDPGRAGTRHCFTINSITPTEFVFSDGFGRTNKASRVAPNLK